MSHLSALVFAVRQALSAQGQALSTGHAQQLAAAALGHNNLASYQASNDEAGLPLASVGSGFRTGPPPSATTGDYSRRRSPLR